MIYFYSQVLFYDFLGMQSQNLASLRLIKIDSWCFGHFVYLYSLPSLFLLASNVTKFIKLKLGSHIFRSCCPCRYEFTSRLTLEIHIDFGISIARHSNFCHCNATQLLKLQLKFLHRSYQSQDSKVIRIINKPSVTLVS